MISAILFAALVVGVGGAALFGRTGWLRAAAYVVLLAGMLGLWQFSLGRPRPLLFGPMHARVLAYQLDEPHAIYLWIVPTGASKPLAIALPWNTMRAKQLMDASRKSAKRGVPLQMGARGKRKGAGQPGKPVTPLFYPGAPPSLPPKHYVTHG